MLQQYLFDFYGIPSPQIISTPPTYKGLSSFHKYWGKKPIECLDYLIQKCTEKNDIILDPFLGSGLISLETASLNRRFIGIDINPFSIEHTKFLLSLPTATEYTNAIKKIRSKIFDSIDETYLTKENTVATHYLWEGEKLFQIWAKDKNTQKKIEIRPTEFDLQKILEYDNYKIRNIGIGSFFENPRINSSSKMTVYDLFTKRALRNIDLLLDEINSFSGNLRQALLLTLTSSSGQMSSMVFAIKNRGKTKNRVSEKIEVGSWVIGLWRPKLHFEINVWNCFENRAKKLSKILKDCHNRTVPYKSSIKEFFKEKSLTGIIAGDSKAEMKNIPDKSVKLIITDPPHSDRIPYLELSEMWNCILNKKANFEKEIVVSNAKERNKTNEVYTSDMSEILMQGNRILKDDGYFLLYFNARDKQSWNFLKDIETKTSLVYLGSFQSEYSANSVVQNNRNGAMKSDYVLVFNHKKKAETIEPFKDINGWSEKMPFGEMHG